MFLGKGQGHNIHGNQYRLKANDLIRMAVVVRDSHDAVILQDLEGRTMAWNLSAVGSEV